MEKGARSSGHPTRSVFPKQPLRIPCSKPERSIHLLFLQSDLPRRRYQMWWIDLHTFQRSPIPQTLRHCLLIIAWASCVPAKVKNPMRSAVSLSIQFEGHQHRGSDPFCGHDDAIPAFHFAAVERNPLLSSTSRESIRSQFSARGLLRYRK
jgi:hypothetical protein